MKVSSQSYCSSAAVKGLNRERVGEEIGWLLATDMQRGDFSICCPVTE